MRTQPELIRSVRRWRWLSWTLKAIVGLLAGILLAAGAFLAFLDTGPGHRFIADKVADLAPRSGLKIVIGRIEGSIWNDLELRNVRLFDLDGQFAEVPLLEVDWQPLGWLANRLILNSVRSELVYLDRLPRLRPGDPNAAILPGFDIHVGRLRVDRLRIGEAVAGTPRMASVAGEADIRSGRALIELRASVREGDKLVIRLDSEPDRDRFDAEVRLLAPEDSVAGAILGTKRAIRLHVTGDGSWSKWDGRALLDLSGRRTADLSLSAASGRYGLSGTLAPSQFLRGKLHRLSAPQIRVAGGGTLADRRLDGRLSLRSPALRVEAAGIIDLAESRFDNVRLGVDLLRPPALFPNMRGQNMRMTVLLNDSFRAARFAYRLTAPRVSFDRTGFENLRAEGRGQLSSAPVKVPVLLTARRVTGVGDAAGGILANLRINGVLAITADRISGQGLALSSDKLKGRLGLLVDLRTGRYDVVLSGGVTRYRIPGLGIVDVTSELKVVPGPGGRGTLVTGTGRGRVRRLDNKFLLGLAGGLPRMETGLVRGSDGVLHFRGLRLIGPEIRIAGNGYRRRDGSFHFEGSGTQQSYGPFAMILDGNISRPNLSLRFQRPNDPLGLVDVAMELDPTGEGYDFRAAGDSHLGPFTALGRVLLPPAEPAIVDFASLAVSGTRATGRLASVSGGFAGRLDVAGGGLDGALLFDTVAEVQRIRAELRANDARLDGSAGLTVRRGLLRGTVLLDPAGTSLAGTLSARGLDRGGLRIASIEATGEVRGGVGRLTADIAGTRGRSFTFRAGADIRPGQVSLSGAGSVERQPLALKRPAVFIRTDDGWRLSPTELTFGGGNATVSGLLGGSAPQLHARVEQMPLGIVDMLYPELGLGGIASGTFDYRSAREGLPSADANLRIRGLTRSGLVLSSRPVDIGVVARLSEGAAAMRAVAVSDGRTIGRAQARAFPVAGGIPIADALRRAPLVAQIRYNGQADTLWRLTGLELFDITGPAAVGADIRGTFDDPLIRGSIRTQGARLESPVTGTVVRDIAASGRFDGARLLLDSFTGTTARGGSVSGGGVFDFGTPTGVGLDILVNARSALLIDRDDLQAQVTGPVRFQSAGSGGSISGALELDSGRFRLGSATAAAQVPRLDVREINRPAEIGSPSQPAKPWLLDLRIKADDRLTVTGLGLNSEWEADLGLKGTVTAPRISGDAELVQGSFDFAGRRFDLERGTIRFQGESPPNPVLDIAAEGGVQGLNATIRVTGRGQEPEITFSSTPALPEDELLSRLIFGTSITNLSAPEALQLAAAVAALDNTGGGLDPINAVRSAVGLDRLRILPADVVTGQGTSIAAGKYLGRRVYAEVVTDGRGYSATQVEYQITRWLSILASISTIGRESVNVRVSHDY